MLLGCRGGVVVEVVDDNRVSVWRKTNVEFEEEGSYGTWSRRVR